MKRVIDLTRPIVAGMPVWPGDAEVEITRVSEMPDAQCNLTKFSMSAHAGTHVDAPFHFVTDGNRVEQLRLEVLMGRAEVLDFGVMAPNSEIDVDMLEPHRERVRSGSRILLRTGWGNRFGSPEFFTEQPALTEAAAQWLVARRIVLLGLAEPALHPKQNAHIHRIILGAGIVLLETLANLEQITRKCVELVALPMPLAGCDGAPARVIAVEEDIM